MSRWWRSTGLFDQRRIKPNKWQHDKEIENHQPSVRSESWDASFSSEELTILHQEDDFVVIHKPWGMRSAPGRPENTHDSAELRLRHLIPTAEGPMSVHRWT